MMWTPPMKSVVVDPGAYDWEGEQPLKRPSAGTMICEMHVRGFTRDPSSGVGPEARGTCAGLVGFKVTRGIKD
jgi:glycogen operon protein